MASQKLLFLTDRGRRHQDDVLAAAPPGLEVTILRGASRPEIMAQLPPVHFLVSEREGTVNAEMIAAGQALRLIQRLGSRVYDKARKAQELEPWDIRASRGL